MAYEPVDIAVEDANGRGISGVLVRAYNESGQVVTDGVTDPSGMVGFLLWAGRYRLRFHKFQVGVKQPQNIEVLTNPLQPGTTHNAFVVRAEVFEPPAASDPRFCRASGFFRNAHGQSDMVVLEFAPVFSSLVLEGSAVFSRGEPHQVTSDANGFAAVDLLRGAIYEVRLVPGDAWQVKVPDSSSTSLPDLLFPTVQEVRLDPSGPFLLNTEERISVTPTVLDSVGVPLDGAALTRLRWSSSDPSIAAVASDGLRIEVRGLAAGICELRAERISAPIHIPDVPVIGVPVTITVQ